MTLPFILPPSLSTPAKSSTQSLSKSTTAAALLDAHIPIDAKALKCASDGCAFEGSTANAAEFAFEALDCEIRTGNKALPSPSHKDARIMFSCSPSILLLNRAL